MSNGSINFEEMGITAQILCPEFLEEIRNEGLAARVERFCNELSEVPERHTTRLKEKYGDDIPQDVRSVGISLGEHMQQIAPYMNPANNSTLAPVFVAAKMSAAMAEVRALNHVLGY